MSQPYHNSYNPFALWRLKHFLRKNRWLLCSLVCLTLLTFIIIYRQLVALPPFENNRIIGEPLFDDPKMFRLDPWLTLRPGAPHLLKPLQIFPAIDPDGVLCPIMQYGARRTLGPSSQYSILNLKTKKILFLAAFKKGITPAPIYRPQHEEIILVNHGEKDSLFLRLCRLDSRFADLVKPKTIACLYRFDSTSGTCLGQLEFPFVYEPIDISPNGRLLLAQLQNSQQALIDLDSGDFTFLPFLPGWCFFENDDVLLANIQNDKDAARLIRYHLTEQRAEDLQLPLPLGSVPLKINYHQVRMARELNLFSQTTAQTVYQRVLVSFGRLLFNDEVTLSFYSTEKLAISAFQPERSLAMAYEIWNNNPGRQSTSWVTMDMETGAQLRSLPEKYYEYYYTTKFLNREYLCYGNGLRIRIVKIDDFMRESYDHKTGRWRP